MIAKMRTILTNPKFPYVFYTLLAIVVLWQLLLPGYVLSLDMVFAPSIRPDLYVNPLHANELPLVYALAALNALIPAWLLQKAILFGILFLSGIGMHRLVSKNAHVSAYFAGILFAINPFTYSRFLAGQWFLLLGYALLPFAIKSFFDLWEEPSFKQSAKCSLLLTAVAVASLHMFALALFVCLMFLIFSISKNREKREGLAKAFRALAALAVLLLLFNAYWIIIASSQSSEIIEADLEIYRARPQGGNIMMTVAGMWGFWRGAAWYGPISLWLIVPILALAVYGAVHSWKTRSTMTAVVVAIIAFALAAGVSSPFTEGLFKWLFDTVPIFSAFRDSHKFAALLAFAYAYLGSLGMAGFVSAVKTKCKRHVIPMVVAMLIFTVPFVHAAPMLFGFSGQLQPTDYPQDWYAAERLLSADSEDFTTLVMPWHLYMDFNWLPNVDKRLATPAQFFFSRPMIQGDNVEIGKIYSTSDRAESKQIEGLLPRRNETTDFGSRIAPMGMKYVILLKEADWRDYAFLYNQTDLEQISETKTLAVFRNMAFAAHRE